MKERVEDFLDTIPQQLLQWARSQPELPSALRSATTFYEAAKAAHLIDRPRRLDRFSAIHTWTNHALLIDERTRKYMSELIHDETDGTLWTMKVANAVIEAMDDLEGEHPANTGRLFRQHRDAAMNGLRMARESMEALDLYIPLSELLTGPKVRNFRRTVQRFEHEKSSRRLKLASRARENAIANGSSLEEQMAAAFGEMMKVRDNRVPQFSDLILAAEASVRALSSQSVDRHGARSKYLREMFSALEESPIRHRRIAFLTYASEAVFNQHIEKRDTRKLVADLAAREKESDNFKGLSFEIDE